MDPRGRVIEGVEITDELIRALLVEHAPEHACLEVGRYYSNVEAHLTVRLGDSHAIRFSRSASDSNGDYATLRVLRLHSREWTFPGQIPLVVGMRDRRLPSAWEIVPWFDGSNAVRSPLTSRGTMDLALALRQVHQVSPFPAPDHTRTHAAVSELTGSFTTAVDACAHACASGRLTFKSDAAHSLWTSAVNAPVDATLTWIHGNLDPRYVISDHGAFAGLIAWSTYGFGDPAHDLAGAAFVAGSDHVERLLSVYNPHITDETLTRARGLLLLSALKHAVSADPQLANLARKRLGELRVLAL